MEALKTALKDLTSTSQARVKAVATAALSNARDYKVVVHEIEKHLWRTEADKRLAGEGVPLRVFARSFWAQLIEAHINMYIIYIYIRIYSETLKDIFIT